MQLLESQKWGHLECGCLQSSSSSLVHCLVRYVDCSDTSWQDTGHVFFPLPALLQVPAHPLL